MEVLIWTLLFNSACPETHKCAIGCTFLKRVVLFITSSPALSITCRFLGTPPNTHIYTFYKTVSNRFYTSVFVYVYIIYAFYLWQSGTFHTRSLHHHSIWLYFLWHPCVPPTPRVQIHTHTQGHNEDKSSTRTYASIKQFLLSCDLSIILTYSCRNY